MKHIIPFYLFFCIASGIAAMVLLFNIYRKTPRKDLFYFSMFFTAMTGNIVINLILMYRSINITGFFGLEDYLLSLLSVPISFVSFSAFPMAVHRILEVNHEKIRNRILIAINAFACSIQYFPVGISYDLESGSLSFGPLYSLIGMTQLIIIVYCVFMLLTGFRKIKNRVIRFLLLLCGGLTLLFIPGFFHDITFPIGQSRLDFFPAEIIFFPLYYFFLAVIIIVYTSKYFMIIIQMEKSVCKTKTFMDDFCIKHDLTDREKEIVPLIVEGLGNKQIADRLCISPKTVNNHIYNLYRKLEINSRFELLAMC